MDDPSTGERDLTRRGVLGAGAAAAAALVAGRRPEEAGARTGRGRIRRPRRVDVVVVGAGLAGLTAARELRRKGRRVVVVEARDRVGGRTYTKHVHGVAVDVGGQWIKTKPSTYGPIQAEITGLARELGVRTFPSYYNGNNVLYRDGSRSTYDPNAAQELPPDQTLPEIIKVFIKTDYLALGYSALAGSPKTGPGISTETPWASPGALEFDGQTVETWKLANVGTKAARDLLDLGVEAVLACEPRDVSLLWFLFYVASAGSLENLISTRQGAQESRFVGGSQQVSNRLARRIGRGRVYLESPVRRISQSGRRVKVQSDRVTVYAKRAIVAVPPALADEIDFHPGLPALRAQLLQRFPMGSVFKAQAFYDKPFWRDDGLTGFTISDQGPCKLTFDNTPPRGKPGVLLGFVEGEEARRLVGKPSAERKRLVLDCFARYFGGRALHPTSYVEQNWLTERWSRGCYVGFTPPGVLSDYGPQLRKPFGRVHWAGTETATRWAGYMDGAVQSGKRAAKEVLDRL
jgi:monoamine oxidase